MLPCNDVTPRMRTEMPPSDVRDTITPGKRSISNCSIGRPGERAISSSVMTDRGISAAGATASVLPSPDAFFWWEQAATTPRSNASSRSAWAEHMSDLLWVMDDPAAWS